MKTQTIVTGRTIKGQPETLKVTNLPEGNYNAISGAVRLYQVSNTASKRVDYILVNASQTGATHMVIDSQGNVTDEEVLRKVKIKDFIDRYDCPAIVAKAINNHEYAKLNGHKRYTVGFNVQLHGSIQVMAANSSDAEQMVQQMLDTDENDVINHYSVEIVDRDCIQVGTL